jgi:hypothetical protein
MATVHYFDDVQLDHAPLQTDAKCEDSALRKFQSRKVSSSDLPYVQDNSDSLSSLPAPK